MRRYTIAVLPGDGVGPEIITEGVKILKGVQKLVSGFELDFTFLDAGAYVYADGIHQDDKVQKIYLDFGAGFL